MSTRGADVLDIDPATVFAARFRHLNIEDGNEVNAVLRIIRRHRGARRDEDVTSDANPPPPRSTIVLLAGVACWYKRREDGRRHILDFQYPGTFCDLQRCLLPDARDFLSLGAITDCYLGIIDYSDIEKILVQHPHVGLALWRSTMLDGSILRERLLNMTYRPALARVAHLLCEQLVRLEAIGISTRTLPFTQIDVADAAGLSPVHMNRTVQMLRSYGALSRDSRAIEVTNAQKLAKIASFDGRYLNMPALPPGWNA
jgi:CRP-like cAMP-binding protein